MTWAARQLSRRSRQPAGQAGFTFIEVLQAVALAAIGLLALSSLTMGTIQANAKARRMTTAATLAQAKMEELRTLPYDTIGTGADEMTESSVRYARSWTVCTDCPIAGTKEITLTVRWQEQADQTVTLQTIISQ